MIGFWKKRNVKERQFFFAYNQIEITDRIKLVADQISNINLQIYCIRTITTTTIWLLQMY